VCWALRVLALRVLTASGGRAVMVIVSNVSTVGFWTMARSVSAGVLTVTGDDVRQHAHAPKDSAGEQEAEPPRSQLNDDCVRA
jgi:hypothetical protein